MAGIITVSPGHDASYPWRQIGTSVAHAQAGRAGVSYYLAPADKGGEPPGRWYGGGLADLGFREGQVIERVVFERLYGSFVDPRDATGETRLGRSPQRFRSADEIFAVLAALEPEATAERRAELLVEAKSQVRAPVQYFDVTFSVSKSITLLHASAMANAARAATAGDLEAVAYWEQAAADVWACVQAGNRAALEYLQREAGYTRSGYHGRQTGEARSGRWEDAHGFVIGSFAQHTSRDGDPQLHIHNLVLNRVRRESDGAYRSLDSRALYEHRGAAAAIATLVMESAISRELGTRWVARADGHGREVRGVSRELMEEFSARRQSISELAARLAAQFEAQFGYAPDTRALGNLRQWANHATRLGKPGEPLDLAAAARRWAAQARASDAGALEPVMLQVTTRRGLGASGPTSSVEDQALSPEQKRDLIGQALGRLQDAQPTWRKADLIRHLGELLPDDITCCDDETAATLLTDLADRVLAGRTGEQVLALEAPEWPPVPDCLRRADGRSVYRPHSGTRYATLAQLRMEERLLLQAQQPGAPRVEPAVAAQLLRADQAQLEAQLRAAAQPMGATRAGTGSGLRLDQAAAAFVALTSDRRAEILVGPAGSGKTRTAAVVAGLWRRAGMGEVYGLTTAQAARNVLQEAGVTLADNTAEFLGHLTGARGARGAKPVEPGTLLLLDEASMMSMADLAALLQVATSQGCRVLITGDHEQLAAVEGGGGMILLTRQMGYVQLADPVRFSCDWERDASLRLRAGDATIVAEYEEHGRVRGGDPDQAMDLACRAYLADHLAGKESLLLARTGEQAREMSRRVREDLLHYGLVRRSAEAQLRYHATASAGDLIVARRNNRRILAGAPGRWLTNRDVLRVEAATGRTVIVRRLAGQDEAGQPAWTVAFELPRVYLLAHCDLAYATTPHAAQGRTVDTSHVLVDGLSDRQGLYVAMSRGREGNYAYCVTRVPRAADIRQGSQAAPELRRMRAIAAERDGIQPHSTDAEPHEKAPKRDAAAILADILRRDGAVLSATETLRRELSDADHLGVLGAIWYDLVRRSQVVRFEAELRKALPAADADAALSDPACTWLWRSLREAECSGLDATQVLRDTVGAAELTGARDVARVIDARIRRLLADRVPQLSGLWTRRVPDMADPQLHRYINELAGAMDDRIRRLGEHAVKARPGWVIAALGDVPADPPTRAEWQRRAAQLSAYRELYGYNSETDAIGPEPGKTSPESRADWHTAFAALGRVEGIDLRGCSDEQLRLRRAAYQRETSWAPPYVAEELRLARLQARTAWENGIRAGHEARAAREPQSADHHRALAAMWRAMERKATSVAGQLAKVQETRAQWGALTEPTRRAAVAADLELRRRHPDMELEPLRSAEPSSVGYAPQSSPSDRDPRHGTLFGADVGEETVANTQEWPSASTPSLESMRQEALGLTPETVHEKIPEQISLLRKHVRMAQARIEDLRETKVPDTEGDDHLGRAWDVTADRRRDAIIQPPRVDIRPAGEILQRAQERMADHEAEPS